MKIFILTCVLLSLLRNSKATYLPAIKATTLQDFPSGLDIKPFIKLDNKLYHFGQSPVSWFKANLICRSMNADLASYDTQQEMSVLTEHLKTHFPRDREWWLSASDLDSEGDWFWYNNGERFIYADWTKGQPNNYEGKQHCGYLTFTASTGRHQMADHRCDALLYYICESEKRNNIIVNIS